MKLHLPFVIRKALLRCVAAAATLATGSAIVAGAIGLMLSAPASAADADGNGIDDDIVWENASGFDLSAYSGNVKVYISSGSPTLVGTLACDNLWLTGAAGYYTVPAGYFNGVTGTIYVDGTGINFGNTTNSFTANLSIGTSASGLNSSNHNTNFVIWATSNQTTSGYLEVRSSANVLVNGVFTVDELRGSGDLYYCDYGGRGLVLTHGGATYSGLLTMCASNDASIPTIKLGDGTDARQDVVLQVRGFSTHKGGTLQENAQILLNSTHAESTATLRITGSDADAAASSVTFGAGVGLELADNAAQSFVESALQGVKIGEGADLSLTESTIAGDLENAGTLHTASNLALGGDVVGSGTYDVAEDATLVMSGYWDIGEASATKSGKGTLELAGAFNTMAEAGQTGSIRVAEGTLKLNYSQATALAAYGVVLEAAGTKLVLSDGGTYVLNGLSGSGSLASEGTSYLIITNDSPSEPWVFSGTWADGVELEVAAGTQALAMEYSTAVSALVSGKGVLDVSRMVRRAGGTLELSTSGSGALVGLQLEDGDRITVQGDALRLLGENSILLSNEMEHIFSFGGKDTALELVDGATLHVDISGVLEDILAAKEAGMSYSVADGSLAGWTLSFGAELAVNQIAVEYGDDGSISFSLIQLADGTVYRSTQDADMENTWSGDDVYGALDHYTAVYVDTKTNVDLTQADMGEYRDGLVFRNLMGSQSGELTVVGKGTGQSLVTISNDFSPEELETLGAILGVNIESKLTYGSNISLKNADLQIKHVGENDAPNAESTTTMLGTLTLSGGQLQMTSGRLELTQQGNDLGDVGIGFAGTDGQIIISGGSAQVGGLVELSAPGQSGIGSREHILIENEGVMELKDGAEIGEGLVIGNAATANGEMAGTLLVQAGSSAKMAAGTQVEHLLLSVEGNLEFTPAAEEIKGNRVWKVAGLTGSGSLKTSEVVARSAAGLPVMDICLADEDRVFSGSMRDFHGTTYIYGSPYTQYFKGVRGGDGWNLVNSEGGRVVFDLMAEGGRNGLRMGSLTLESGSYTTVILDMEAGGGFSLSSLTIDRGADVTLAQYEDGSVLLPGAVGSKYRVFNADEERVSSEGVVWHLHGVRNAQVVTSADGSTWLEVTQDQYEIFRPDNGNSLVGSAMMEALTDTHSIGGALGAVDNAMLELMSSNTAGDHAEANKMLAAVAGSSTTTLGQAVAADMERQLRAIRNRTSAVATLEPAADGKVNSGIWLNAEANYYKQDADGMLPGFKMTGWGGTVGAAFEQSADTTVGVALTAMYNDVESDTADHLKGDMDAYYFSAFAKVSSGSWNHLFICSIGSISAELNRTVNYGTGSYTNHGSTDGLALGMMYEVAYTLPAADHAKITWQPVANIAWRLTQLDAYSESGSNAALNVGEQELSTVTLGLGMRMQAEVGTGVWNRRSILEGRLLGKADLGDRSSEASVGLQQLGFTSGKVTSAERSALGLEIGLALTAPITRRSDIFIDLSADLRSSDSNFNAAVGYKVSF